MKSFEKVDKVLNNKFTLISLLVFSFVMWALSLVKILVPIIGVYCFVVCAFSKDPKSVFAVIFSIPFFLENLSDSSCYVFYGIGIALAVLGLIVFVLKAVFYDKIHVTKGKLFWGFVALAIASMLGGIVGFFNILAIVIALAICALLYFLYFVMLNFCHDLKDFSRKYFIIFGFSLFVQLIYLHILSGDFIHSVLNKGITYVGAQNANAPAVYFLLAMFSFFWIAYEKKEKDYLYCLGAYFYVFATFFVYSRISTLQCAIFAIICFVMIFCKSQNKKALGITIGVIVLCVLIFAIIFWDGFYSAISRYLSLGFKGNGRDELWPWCFDKFFSHPVFGVGFVDYAGSVPTVASSHVIMAHNTFLQFLTSTGFVGLLLAGYFYFNKYRIICNNFADYNTYIFLVSVALSCVGIFDQCMTMDPFIFTISIMYVVMAEIHNRQISLASTTIQEERNKNDKKSSGAIDNQAGKKTNAEIKNANSSLDTPKEEKRISSKQKSSSVVVTKKSSKSRKSQKA